MSKHRLQTGLKTALQFTEGILLKKLQAPVLIAALIAFLCCFPGEVFSRNGGGVTVFVVDTGIDDIFVEKGTAVIDPAVSHGSIVSRIIREEAPGVQLIPHSAAGEGGRLREDLYLAGLRRIIDYQRAHPRERVLVNISLAFSDYLIEHHRLLKELSGIGVLVIAAAGNQGAERVVYPAGFGEVVAVANAGREGKAGSSNYGLHIDLSAPGSVEYITRVYFSDGVGYSRLKNRGTSFSAPRVTGLLARILLDHPGLSPREGLEIIEENADPIDDKLFKAGLLGAGVINQERALAGPRPFYREDWFFPVLLLLLLLVLTVVIIERQHGIAGIFILILFLLVGLPLIFLLAGQLYISYHGSGPGPGVILGLAVSIGLVIVLTGWSPGVILFFYLFLFLIPIFLAPLFPGSLTILTSRGMILLSWLPAALLFVLERSIIFFSYYQLYRGKRTGPLIYLLGIPSRKVNTLVSRGLVVKGSEQEGVSKRLKAALSGTESRRKRTSLIRVLVGLAEPPLEYLLSFGGRNDAYRELIIDSLLERGSEIIPGLFRALHRKKGRERWLAGTLLSRTGERLSPASKKELLDCLIRALQDGDYDREIILLSLAGFKQEASRAVPRIMELLKEEGDNWLRFQALRTLVAVHPRPEELLPLLKELSLNSPEPVRSEARGQIKEISGLPQIFPKDSG